MGVERERHEAPRRIAHCNRPGMIGRHIGGVPGSSWASGLTQACLQRLSSAWRRPNWRTTKKPRGKAVAWPHAERPFRSRMGGHRCRSTPLVQFSMLAAAPIHAPAACLYIPHASAIRSRRRFEPSTGQHGLHHAGRAGGGAGRLPVRLRQRGHQRRGAGHSGGFKSSFGRHRLRGGVDPARLCRRCAVRRPAGRPASAGAGRWC